MWWKWLPVSNVVALLIPDGLVDLLPGSYGKLDESGNSNQITKIGFISGAG